MLEIEAKTPYGRVCIGHLEDIMITRGKLVNGVAKLGGESVPLILAIEEPRPSGEKVIRKLRLLTPATVDLLRRFYFEPVLSQEGNGKIPLLKWAGSGEIFNLNLKSELSKLTRMGLVTDKDVIFQDQFQEGYRITRLGRSCLFYGKDPI